MSGKKDIVSSFFSKVEMKSLFDCWLWTGGLKPNGYGVFCVNRYGLYAHRWSYEYHNGAIPDGLVIDHICRNKQCVNPAHLRAVTQKENLAYHFTSLTHCAKGHLLEGGSCKECLHIREKRKFALAPKRLATHCSKGHALTDDNIYRYGSSRNCKVCQKENSRINREKRKQGIRLPLKDHCKQ